MNIIITENKYKQKIVLDSHDRISRRIMNAGIYDAIGIFYIEKILAQLHQPIAFDIGANIGNHALVMAKYCDQVYLFEPQRENVQLLTQTQTINNIINWQIFPVGLGNEDGSLTLYKHAAGNNGASTFIPELSYQLHTKERCEIRIGDTIVVSHAIPKIDFIKLDVEGYEAKVLLGLVDSIKKFRPIIMLEWNNTITKMQFHEYQLFRDVFCDYEFKAIVSNKHKLLWNNKLFGKLRHYIFSKLLRKKWQIIEFNKSDDYQHVIFIPKEKSLLINQTG